MTQWTLSLRTWPVAAVALWLLPAPALLAQGLAPLAGDAPVLSPALVPTPVEPDNRWVLGATLASSPAYTGGTSRKLGLRPVVAGRVGRWMVSSASARSLAGMDLAGGISTTVLQDERWSVGVGARLTHGRSSGDDPVLSGLPNIRSSLGLRGSVGYTLAPGWRVSGSAQQDVLRGQGLRANLGLGWSTPLDNGWVLSAGGSVGWANARAMQTFYGVGADAARAGRPAWQPGAGLESWGWSVGVSRVLSPHWRLAGSIGRSTLLGDAASSPLTLQRSANVAQVTLAYVGW